MATGIEDALASLTRNRLRQSDVVDPLVQSEATQKLLQEEAARNLKNVGVNRDAAGNVTGGFATGATTEEAEPDVTDPYTGTAQRAAVTYNTPIEAQKRADALATALAPINAKSAGDLAVEQEKTRGAVEAMKQSQDPLRQILARQAAGGGSIEGEGFDAMGNQQFKMNIGAKGGVSLAQQTVPQNIQAQQHAAQIGLQQYPSIKERIKAAMDAGVTGPIAGSIYGKATSGQLPDSLWSYLTPDKKQQTFTQLNSDLGLLGANLAYAHGAARGGASPAMQEKFRKMFNPGMSTPALLGSMQSAERWLSAYADATGNFTHLAAPERMAQLDAMDGELFGSLAPEPIAGNATTPSPVSGSGF
jgi:hypothetical protein